MSVYARIAPSTIPLLRPESEELRWPDGSEDRLLQLVNGSIEHQVGLMFFIRSWDYIAAVLDTRQAQLLKYLEEEAAKRKVLAPVIEAVKIHVLKGSFVHDERPPSTQALGIRARVRELTEEIRGRSYLFHLDLHSKQTQQPATLACTAVFLVLHMAPRIYLVLQLSMGSADESGQCSIQAVSLAGSLLASVRASLKTDHTAWLAEELAGQVGKPSAVLRLFLPDGTLMEQGPTKLIEAFGQQEHPVPTAPNA